MSQATAESQAAGGGQRKRILEAGNLPLPGGGDTAARFAGLAGLGAEDLSLGRLAEGHADAVAILAEAGRAARPDAVYGVWAAAGGPSEVRASREGERWVLGGEKPFCSGASMCDRALVRCLDPGGDLLFEVDLRQEGVTPLPGTWPAVGMAASDSGTVRFDTAAASPVGGPGFYTGRPGFWHGGAGVAAVWGGGARGMFEAVRAAMSDSAGDTEWSALGGAAADVECIDAVVASAAAAVDADPADRQGDARRVALVTRHAVHAASTRILAGVAAAGGARPLCLDPQVSRRAADLYAYLAKYHPGRDGAALGRLRPPAP